MIVIRHLKKEYPNITPLQDVNCTIDSGDIVSIIGPSGTGKSTLLRCINRLETATDGEIWIDGINVLDKKTDVNKVRRKMGMVFQSFNLFSHLMIIENIMLGPMDLLGVSKQEAYDEGIRLLRMVGLGEKAFSYPDELSGGQKQRAAIARTLAMKPEILLFDEPTSALDPTMIGEVLTVIRQLASEGLTMLIVTHEMKFARDISTRVFYMDEGVIYEEGNPKQIFDQPKRGRTRVFVKRLKTYTFETHSRDFDFLGVSGAIQDFGFKQALTPKHINKLQLVFEELCVNVLRSKLPEREPFLRFVVEYSDTDNTVTLETRCNGSEFNPLSDSTDDELSSVLIRRMTEDFTSTYEDGINIFRCCLPLLQ